MKRILLIDDDHITNMLNERIIKYTQVSENVHVCISAQKALNLILDFIDKQESIPEVILLDIRMPIMDGFGFLEEFIKLPEAITSDVKIAMLTSSLEESEKERAFKFVDNELKCIRKDKSMKYPSRSNLRKFIYYTFSLIEVKNEEIINEYLTLKKEKRNEI